MGANPCGLAVLLFFVLTACNYLKGGSKIKSCTSKLYHSAAHGIRSNPCLQILHIFKKEITTSQFGAFLSTVHNSVMLSSDANKH